LDSNGLSVREVELMERLNKLEGKCPSRKRPWKRRLTPRLIGIAKELSGLADTEGIYNSNNPVPTSNDANVKGITSPQPEAGMADKHNDESAKSSTESTAPREKDKGTLVILEGGTSRYVSYYFWARV